MEKPLDTNGGQTCFVLMFRSAEGERLARVVVDSLRAFGGPLRNSPVWAFVSDPDRAPQGMRRVDGVQCFPLVVDDGYRSYPFANKVYAYATAEAAAGPEIRSLVWLSLDCLVVNPPLLFDLGPSFDAAFRPVHHRNVGSPAREPLDDYWQGVYRAVGIGDMPYTVESFIDSHILRPYFNTHCFALNPAKGLGQAWWDYFRAMVTDKAFQSGPCRDELHQVFLHQAILSTLTAKLLEWERVRLLPRDYNYPLNLLSHMPPNRRAHKLNGLVNAVYEDAFPWSDCLPERRLRPQQGFPGSPLSHNPLPTGYGASHRSWLPARASQPGQSVPGPQNVPGRRC
jgi:hypothetical protein